MKKFACTSEAAESSADNSLQKEMKSSVIAVDSKKVKTVKTDKKSFKTVKKDKFKKTSGFKNNDEIKQEYGKIETVYLFSGEVYTGAVIQNDAEKYTIVTVGGVINIPMSEVKIRNIIK
ncbi:MAG TPA: hypothetical protein PKU84_03650 [Spirochaetota bacterium]|nr:hypothetical protein [Spirochaetota bacterium]HPK55569.1 hypothetical protein [Spirochaetota bacterium]